MTLTSVRLEAPAPTAELKELYRGFEQELLVPPWAEIGDLIATILTAPASTLRRGSHLLEPRERTG